jgi:hypothetical protein
MKYWALYLIAAALALGPRGGAADPADAARVQAMGKKAGELDAVAQAYWERYGYDARDFDGPDPGPEGEEAVDVRLLYYHYPYPYWWGHPRWYPSLGLYASLDWYIAPRVRASVGWHPGPYGRSLYGPHYHGPGRIARHGAKARW